MEYGDGRATVATLDMVRVSYLGGFLSVGSRNLSKNTWLCSAKKSLEASKTHSAMTQVQIFGDALYECQPFMEFL
jgi:hypothetical protein